MKVHDNLRVVQFVEEYWNSRNDITGLTLESGGMKKVA
jgi:hypothetical protein